MALLRGERETVIRRWGAVSDVTPGVTADVVDGLAAALSGAPEELDQLAEKLASSPHALSAADLGSLRTIVHHLCIEKLPIDDATRAVAAVSAEIDDLIATIHGAEIALLESAALTDVLTGAGNRRALEREFPQMQAAAARHGEPIALVLIDLDGLKGINDRHGHPAGDAALRRLASGLTSEPRDADAVYRLGGDEFVLLLPSTDAVGADEVLKRLPSDLPRFSYGVAVAPLDGDGLVEVLDAADRRLLDAKAGRSKAPPAALRPDRVAPRNRHLVLSAIGALTLCTIVLVVSIVAGRVDDVTATMALQAAAISAMSLAAVGLVSRAAPFQRALAAAPVALGLWLALGVGPAPSPLAPQASDPADRSDDTETALPPTTVPDVGPATTPAPAVAPAPSATPAPGVTTTPAAATTPAPVRPRAATPAPAPTTPAPTAPTTPAPAAPAAPADTDEPSGGSTVGGASDTDAPPPGPPAQAPPVDTPAAGGCACVEAQSHDDDEGRDDDRRGRRDKRDTRRGPKTASASHDGANAPATTFIAITVPPVAEAVGAEAADSPSGDAEADAPSGEGADVVSAEPTAIDTPLTPAVVDTTIQPAATAVPTEVPAATPQGPAAAEHVVDTSATGAVELQAAGAGDPVSAAAAPLDATVVDC